MPEPTPPFAESIPRQALALAGWVAFWMAVEHLLGRWGLAPRQQVGVLLAVLAAAALAAILAARAWLFRLATSVRFALAQGAFLIGATAAATRSAAVFPSLWFGALLAVLAASMLAVTWKRRPYTLARLGFLLVHTAPALVFLGLLWGRMAGIRATERLPAGTTLDTLHPAGGPVPLPGFRLRLVPRPAPGAADNGSELVVLDAQERELARKLIRPGEPLDFRGYRFQLAQDGPRDPATACLEVVREPGLRLIQAGFCSLLLGCAWMFYLKPGLKRRAQGGKEARP